MFKKFFWAIAATVGLGAVTGGLAASAAIASGKQSSATAVSGYDLVSFFQPGNRPVVGNARHAVLYKNMRYLFASQVNADKFKASPATFLPQYGGYCAWAAAQGQIAPGYPKYASVVKGKLYLNYDAGVKATWSTDIPGFIAKADRNWPKIAPKAR